VLHVTLDFDVEGRTNYMRIEDALES